MNAILKKLNSKRTGKKGFTLMEMLIVVAIIAIMVAIAIPTFTSALDKAHRAVDQANIRSAYAEYKATKMTEEAPTGLPTDDATALTYVEGKSGTLQHFTGVDFDAEPWVGTP